MKEKIKIIVFAVVQLLLLSILFSGCSLDDIQDYYDRDVSLAIIAGKHANLPALALPSSFFDDSQSDSILRRSDRVQLVVGVIPDGKPLQNNHAFLEDSFKDIDLAKSNERWDTVQNKVTELIVAFQDQAALHEEVDTLAAFHFVANCFQQQPEKNSRIVLVFDSGLCTTGALSFIEHTDYKQLLEKDEKVSADDTNYVVNQLTSKNELPNLSGVHIRWYGMGLVGGSQKELSRLQILNLSEIWKAILSAAGAEVELCDVNQTSDVRDDSDLPIVSTIVFDEEIAICLGEDVLGFEPDKATFLPGTEEQRARVLADYVSEARTNGILIVGTASTGGQNEEKGVGFQLSLDRAKAVRNEFVKLGVPESKIEILGLGTKSHKYNPAEFENGEYNRDSAAAIGNRSVYIMSITSLEAQEFRADYNDLLRNE